MKTIDLVVPCYNEEAGLEHFVLETNKVIDSLPEYSFRYILVNDGSKDRTYLIMKKLAKAFNNIKYISFSRNFGKEAAMYAGLRHTTADYVVVMDADLQHPPQLFPQMIQAVEHEGYDCCATKRAEREGESKFRGIFSKLFFKLSNRLTDVKMPFMDGIQLIEECKKDDRNEDMKCVIFSGCSEFDYARKAVRLGVSDYILKPVDPSEFKETITRVIQELEAERAEKNMKKKIYQIF